MIQIRIHGRGGQGVVTAAELIAIAGFKEGLYSQALPYFGVERSGAPIQAFARLSKKNIILREHIYKPSFIIIQDVSLLSVIDTLFGADKKTEIIINTSRKEKEVLEIIKDQKIQSFIPELEKIRTLDATQIALEIFGKNLMNTVILGAFAKMSGLISLPILRQAIIEKFSPKGIEIVKKNQTAAEHAYQKIKL